MDNMYDLVSVNYVHQLNQALRAKELYHRDKDYLVADGEVKIVDEFTGRTLDGRRWSDGLHQAVEAKERVRINEENHTWATVTLQNYFRLYEKLAGMTGTAETEAAEFASTYNVPVVPIPTNMPHGPDRPARPDLQDRGGQVQRRGRGHRRTLRDGPARPGRHRLGGQVRAPVPAARAPGHPPRGPERQAARPGGRDRRPGGPAARRDGGHQHGRPWRRHPPGGQPRGSGPATRPSARDSTSTTEEGQAEYQKLLARFEKECGDEGDDIRELGGLYVLGSERHESRRIDNQLRGRSGRQGDPGESRFFLSPRGRAHAALRHRRHAVGDGPGPCPTTCPSRPRW